MSDGKQAICQSGHRLIGGHHIEFWRERSGYVSHTPLGLSFNGSLWFGRQLQNGRLLAPTQCCQERDPAIRKFQRIVMRRNLVFVDLPKDRGLRAKLTIPSVST